MIGGMSPPLLVAMLALLAYLIGSLSGSLLLGRFRGVDIRRHGSGNAGTTNMIRSFGFKPGAVTFIGDFVKAALGVLAGYLLMGAVCCYIGGLFVVEVGPCPGFAHVHSPTAAGAASRPLTGWTC